MVHTRVFNVDAQTGITQLFHYDDVTDESWLETTQEVGDLVENNKAQFNAFDERARYSDGMNRMASLPLHVFMDLRKRGIIDYTDPKQKKFVQWLNDRDNSVFRTRPGRL